MLFPYPVFIPYNNTDKNIIDYTLNNNLIDKFRTIYIIIVFINILVAIFFILKFIIKLMEYNATKNMLNNNDINQFELSSNLVVEKYSLDRSFITVILFIFVSLLFHLVLLNMFL